MALFRPSLAWLTSLVALDSSVNHELRAPREPRNAPSRRRVSCTPKPFTTERNKAAAKHVSSSPLGSLAAWAPSVALAVLLSACSSNECERDCADSDEPPSRTAEVKADAGPSSNTTGDKTSATSIDFNDAAAVAPEVYSCRDDGDCVATGFSACSQQLNQCVVCTKDAHCNGERTHCFVAASDEQNHCVECLSGAECASGLCIDALCVACNPENNHGCNDATCVISDSGSPRCVECDDDQDCGAGVCVDNQCLTCDINDNRGCTSGTYCLDWWELDGTQQADAGSLDTATSSEHGVVCVECGESKPCADPARPVCSNNACVACDPSARNDNGCQSAVPFCLPALNDSGGLASRCVECIDSNDCQNAQCVDNACHPCDPHTHAGCEKSDICEPLEGTTGLTYACVQCNALNPCQNGEHCGDDGRCYECLASSDCSDATKPACLPDGMCGPCNHDSQCDAEKAPYCSLGLCFACTKDEHCADSNTGPVCFTATHQCVECTESNLYACGGNPCDIFTNRCHTDTSSEDGGQTAECRRCTHTEDCDALTECAVLAETNLRCVPLASTALERDDCKLTELEGSDGVTREYCVPSGC